MEPLPEANAPALLEADALLPEIAGCFIAEVRAMKCKTPKQVARTPNILIEAIVRRECLFLFWLF